MPQFVLKTRVTGPITEMTVDAENRDKAIEQVVQAQDETSQLEILECKPIEETVEEPPPEVEPPPEDPPPEADSEEHHKRKSKHR